MTPDQNTYGCACVSRDFGGAGMSLSWMADQIIRAQAPHRTATLYSPAVRELLDVLGPGLTAPEIAAALDVPLRTARNRIASAKRHGLIVGDGARRGTPMRWRVAG